MSENKEKIESLTDEQIAKIPEYVEYYNKVALSYGPTDRAEAERAFKDLYALMNKTDSRYNPNPQIFWEEGPHAGAVKAAQLQFERENVTEEEVASQADSATFGTFEAYWLHTYKFITDVVNKQPDELVEIVNRIIHHCGICWTFEDAILLTPKPIMVKTENNRIHCVDGPAIVYPNGEQLFAIEGDQKSTFMEVALAQKAKEAAKTGKDTGSTDQPE